VDSDAVGMVSGVGRGMGVLDGGRYRRRGRSTFGGEFESSHCNQWGLCYTALPKLLWAVLVYRCNSYLQLFSVTGKCQVLGFAQSIHAASVLTVI